MAAGDTIVVIAYIRSRIFFFFFFFTTTNYMFFGNNPSSLLLRVCNAIRGMEGRMLHARGSRDLSKLGGHPGSKGTFRLNY